LYDKTYEKVSHIINGLTNDLRNVFRDRKKDKMQTGKKSGSRINIGRRITELAEKILPIESRAWERRSAPDEKDYAISLLVDLSGSMRGNKISETFKAVVVLAEVLNKIGIKTEILGFNNKIYEYLNFGEKMTKSIREKMSVMSSEVSSHGANWNDDGWALEQTSKRLNNQREKVKILISLSDGVPEPSEIHAGWDLGKVISSIMEKMKIKLIGLGIGSGTSHVSSYYPKSIANVSVEEMAEQIAKVVKEAIVNYD
jgi:cobaltochelatase CobT